MAVEELLRGGERGVVFYDCAFYEVEVWSELAMQRFCVVAFAW